MHVGARLFAPSPKPAGGMVTPAVRAPRIKFAKAVRDPRFLKVMAQLQQSARRVGQRPPAKRKADEAQAAAKAPANEKVAGARANQVDDMKAAKVEKPGKGGFLAILRAEIDKIMPKNLDQADKFMEGGESGQIKGGVGKNVSDQKQKASGPTEEATKAPPDTGKVEGKEVAAMPAEPAPAPPPVAGAEAMPAPKPQAEVAKTAADASTSADKQLKDAELTDTQLQKANPSSAGQTAYMALSLCRRNQQPYIRSATTPEISGHDLGELPGVHVLARNHRHLTHYSQSPIPKADRGRQ